MAPDTDRYRSVPSHEASQLRSWCIDKNIFTLSEKL
jgi:hypothetical protein